MKVIVINKFYLMLAQSKLTTIDVYFDKKYTHIVITISE